MNQEPCLPTRRTPWNKSRITGIAYSRDEARISITGVPNVPGVSAKLFGPLADGNINVDMIVQNVTEGGGETDITFTVPRGDVQRALAIVNKLHDEMKFKSVHSAANVAKVSVVGVGMRSHSGIAGTMFKALAEKKHQHHRDFNL
jgi:aspartate kinase